MTRFLLGLAAVALAWMASHASAGCRALPEIKKPEVAKKETYLVQSTGCRGYRRVLGKYDTAQEAIRAAEKFRAEKNSNVAVSTGNETDALLFPVSAASFTVYRNPCKGFVEHAKADSLKKALEMAEQIKKDGEAVEIVYHFAAK